MTTRDDARQKAIEDMKKIIREKRADIAPEVLEKARLAAENKMAGGKKAAEKDPSTVPYDKKSAQKAIALFLQDHPEQESFTSRLLEQLKKKDH